MLDKSSSGGDEFSIFKSSFQGACRSQEPAAQYRNTTGGVEVLYDEDGGLHTRYRESPFSKEDLYKSAY